MQREYRPDIQVLRGIAVAAVVLFHAKENYFPQGYLGVDVFFVISGFVVTPMILSIFTTTSATRQRLSHLKTFYQRRFYRLAPALLSTLVLSAVLFVFFAPVEDFQRISGQGIATLLLFGNLGAYKYSGGYFSPNPNPLVHMWSLSVEEQIYIFLPLLLIIILRKRVRIDKVIVLTLALISALSLLSFSKPSLLQPIYSIMGIDIPYHFSFYSSIDRVWQFVIGGFLFISVGQKKFLSIKFTPFFPTIIVIALLVFLFLPFATNSRVGSILATTLAVLVILTRGLDFLPQAITFSLRYLGDRSYSIYLLHMPLIYLAKFGALSESLSKDNQTIQIVLAVGLTILLGNLSYLLIENRYRIKISQKFSVSHAKREISFTFLVSVALLLSLNMMEARGIVRDPSKPMPSKVLPWEWDTRCTLIQVEFDSKAKPCFYPIANAKSNYLLVGDSHAASISKSLVSIAHAKNANLYVFTYAGCPFITNRDGLIEGVHYPYLVEGCLMHNREIIHFIKSVNIEILFYTHRSTYPYVIPASETNRANFNSKIHSELPKLKKYTKEVKFLGITPEYTPVNTLSDKLLNKKGSFLDIAAFDNNYWKLSLADSQIQYIELYPLFCRNLTDCNFRDRGVWLFHDNNHLSQAGGELIKSRILQSIPD